MKSPNDDDAGFYHDTNVENDAAEDGDLTPDDQENIEEAVHHVNTALLPSHVSFVLFFESVCCKTPNCAAIMRHIVDKTCSSLCGVYTSHSGWSQHRSVPQRGSASVRESLTGVSHRQGRPTLGFPSLSCSDTGMVPSPGSLATRIIIIIITT